MHQQLGQSKNLRRSVAQLIGTILCVTIFAPGVIAVAFSGETRRRA